MLSPKKGYTVYNTSTIKDSSFPDLLASKDGIIYAIAVKDVIASKAPEINEAKIKRLENHAKNFGAKPAVLYFKIKQK